MFEFASQRTKKLITNAGRILVVTHVAPDGDAIGSLLGMRLILRHLSKSDVTLACDDRVPEKYSFLPGAAKVSDTTAGHYDLILSLDCSDERRGGEVYRRAKNQRTPVVNIDHHITNTEFGEINIVQPETAATTQVLLRLMKSWGLELDTDIASCLLTGLVTDTLCFRTANVTPEVMEVAAELMQAGADLSTITQRTVNRKSFNAVRYWGPLLQSVRLQDRVVWAYASAETRRAAGYRFNGDASVVSFLITAWEADMAATFIETDEGQVEVSMRAKPGFDVAGVALELGGGGHPAAAGCSMDGPLAAAMEYVLDKMKAAQQLQAEEL